MKLTGALIVLIGTVLSSGAAQAALDGQSFDGSYRVPNIDTPYAGATVAPGSFVVGAGVEAVVNVEDVTFVSVDFSDTSLSLVLNTNLSQPTWGSADFNGLVFDLTSPGALGITGVTIDAASTLAGFDASRVILSGNRIGIDWGGLSYVDGTRLVVDFSFAPAVPEPSTYALMLAGLGVVGLIRKRRATR